MKVRTTTFAACAMLLVCGWLAGPAGAVVQGVCSNCHTMHNSQDNAEMILDTTQETHTATGVTECAECHAHPRVSLLRYDCAGCHANDPAGGSNIINIGTSPTPQIYHNGSDLAAGNYRYVAEIDDTNGHNTHGLGGVIPDDFLLGNTPPGYDDFFNPASSSYDTNYHADFTASQIICAGTQGCHGDRDIVEQTQAMYGTHHADDSILKLGAGFTLTGQGGDDSGKSYRFLKNVKGGEDDNWEADGHNEYYGEPFDSARAAAAVTWSDIDSISEFCAECHGFFHYNTGTGLTGTYWDGTPLSAGIQNASGEWIRHPTDVVLTNSAPYSSYTVYSTQTPVARPAATFVDNYAGDASVNPGTDIVMCLSCHRPHASPYSDSLRFDYSTMLTGATGSAAGTGCFRCHGDKDGA